MNSNLGTLPIFRSTVQEMILQTILSSDTPKATADLIRATGSPQPTVHREVTRLVNAGLLRMTRIGRSTLYAADSTNPLIAPLRSLVMIASSPQPMLSEALRGLSGIEYATIFGSFAARSTGAPGASPDDIDVLVVGSPDRMKVYEAVAGIESAVGREVNITFLSKERWDVGSEEIVKRINAEPTIDLVSA